MNTPALSADALKEISDKWLNVCGSHDYGFDEYGCNCPPSDADPRPDISRLVQEIERLRRLASDNRAGGSA